MANQRKKQLHHNDGKLKKLRTKIDGSMNGVPMMMRNERTEEWGSNDEQSNKLRFI